MDRFRRVLKSPFVLTSVGLATMCLTLGGTLHGQTQWSAQDTYDHKCAVCHGKDGSGNTPMGKSVKIKSAHETMKDSEADMIKAVTDGKGDYMAAYGKQFTPEQIKGLVDYYRSLGQK